jgi:hypothetical protein
MLCANGSENTGRFDRMMEALLARELIYECASCSVHIILPNGVTTIYLHNNFHTIQLAAVY